MVEADSVTEANGAASVNSTNHPSSVKHIKMVLNADSIIT